MSGFSETSRSIRLRSEMSPTIGRIDVVRGRLRVGRDDVVQRELGDLALADPAVRQEPLGELAADHAGRAGDEDVHRQSLSMRRWWRALSHSTAKKASMKRIATATPTNGPPPLTRSMMRGMSEPAGHDDDDDERRRR